MSTFRKEISSAFSTLAPTTKIDYTALSILIAVWFIIEASTIYYSYFTNEWEMLAYVNAIVTGYIMLKVIINDIHNNVIFFTAFTVICFAMLFGSESIFFLLAFLYLAIVVMFINRIYFKKSANLN